MRQLIKNLLPKPKVAGVIFYVLLIAFYYSALSPSESIRPKFMPQLFEGADKVVHFIAFALLSFFLAAYRSALGMLKVILILFLVGLSIEILQHYMPYGRTFDVKDLIANLFGSIFGVWLFYKLNNFFSSSVSD